MWVVLYEDEDGAVVVGVFESQTEAALYCVKKNEGSADNNFGYEYGEIGGDENY
ncbi:hypothetical protein [Levilactobacillus acidifarinae]|uniref:hypothetical protein n=1 Tax=Levilactobacillus acidifarinae TaxID=267364 RepID=UPI000AE768CA|nr:hypothetical protein [Levilactobacillus acidifarinae]GEO70523.1 hypothetical protein LAC03_24330 [Levilactobacillus acidifarinae]